MPAPEHNQNAVKDESERASSFLHAKVAPDDKGMFKAAAEEWAKTNKVEDKRGVLTMWVLTQLRAAVPQSIRDRFTRSKP